MKWLEACSLSLLLLLSVKLPAEKKMTRRELSHKIRWGDGAVPYSLDGKWEVIGCVCHDVLVAFV